MSGFEIFLRFERYNIGCEMEEKIVKTKILIVDDEHGIVDMIQSYFQKQYDILTAYSGQEALQKIASNPDLILLDINMPDMDGLTVCQKVRDYITCPILFLTARIESSDKIIGFQAGADDYIVKPFRFLYKGIIIKHNKTEPTYTKTSLFLCEKRRFFMGRTEKGGKVF